MRPPVTRSPSDVLRLVVALAVVVVGVVVGHFWGTAVAAFLADLLRGLERLPQQLVAVVLSLGELLRFGLVLAGLVVVVRRREWRLLGSALLAVLAAGVLAAVLSPVLGDEGNSVVRVAGWLPDLARETSAATIAGTVALTSAVSPWLTRRWRRLWWLGTWAVILADVLGGPISFDRLVAVPVGWAAGAAVVALLGAPSRRPTVDAVVAGLESVGVPLEQLEPASVDARGSTPYLGRAADGTPLFVKTLGADERSADLLFRLYRRIQPRDLHDERPFSSLRRAVEHEALVALFAGQAGIRTPRLVAVAPAEPNGFTLAYEAVAGGSLDRWSPDDVGDDVLAQVWSQLGVLRQRRIAHRDLRLANVFLGDDGVAWIIDFGFSELAADDTLLATDVAELLASSASLVGPDRALAAATSTVGPAVVASALPRLQPAFLSGATRTALHDRPGLLPELRRLVG